MIEKNETGDQNLKQNKTIAKPIQNIATTDSRLNAITSNLETNLRLVKSTALELKVESRDYYNDKVRHGFSRIQ